jgi:hypothetical protein
MPSTNSLAKLVVKCSVSSLSDDARVYIFDSINRRVVYFIQDFEVIEKHYRIPKNNQVKIYKDIS